MKFLEICTEVLVPKFIYAEVRLPGWKPFLGTIKDNVLILRDSKDFEFDVLTHEDWNHMKQKCLQLIQTNLNILFKIVLIQVKRVGYFQNSKYNLYSINHTE